MVPIAITSLSDNTVVAFDVYVAHAPDAEPILFASKGSLLTTEKKDTLGSQRNLMAYVREDDQSSHRRYVESNLSVILADPLITTESKSDILYNCARGLMSDIMAEPRSKHAMQRARDLVSNTSRFMREEARSFQCLLKVASYDYYTYTHSVNVFMFSMAQAERIGSDILGDIQVFGEGALLHDIGKSQIDPAIVNCKGKLDASQWAEMRKHPEYGEAILVSLGITNPVTLDVTRHHHEKIPGGGYPDNLSGDAISTHARIVTISDIFDALTTQRSYKNALHTFQALQLMKTEMYPQLDPALFREFVVMMADAEG